MGLLAEEVFSKVYLTIWTARQVGEVEGRDAEHLAGPFAVARRDDRRVDPEEAALVIETMDRLRERMADARDGPDEVGPWP